MPEEKLIDLGQMRRNEMKPNLAAIHKDFEIANEASTDLTDTFNQTLSSDQLLCVIYKLLTLYKPNFAAGTCPASASKSKVQKYPYTIGKPTTLKPIDDTILYNLALSKTSNPLGYKSLWNYHTSLPNEFGYDAATCVGNGLSDSQMSIQKAASILDTLPLVKTFNKYGSLPGLPIDGDFSQPFSAPINRPHEGSLSSLQVKNQKHQNEINRRSENLNHIDSLNYMSLMLGDRVNTSTRNIQSNDALTEQMRIVSNATAKQMRQPPTWPHSTEDTYDLYSNLLQQLQDNEHNHQNNLFQSSGMDFLHSLTRMQQAQNVGKNQSSPDFSSNYIKAHSSNVHQTHMQPLRNKNNARDRGVDKNKFSEPVSAYYSPEKSRETPSNFSDHNYFSQTVNYEKNPSENFNSNNRPSHMKLSNKTCRKEKQPAEKRKKKFQLQIKKKSKVERKKKTYDFDFLDLLSKSMIRESKNFEGRI